MISLSRFVVRSLLYHWRINLAVALGVAAATAVLTGALLVGDSVRGSLRGLTLQRLGRIDEVLVSDRFFRAKLARELADQDGFAQFFTAAVPAIIFPSGTIERPGTAGQVTRAAGITVLGSPPSFWELDTGGGRPEHLPRRGEIVLNRPLAEELGARVGDQLILRLPKSDQVPAETPMGEKAGRVRGISELKVVDIIPAVGLGRFSLHANQTSPRNAYVSLDTLQLPLDVDDRVNSILVAGQHPTRRPPVAASQAIRRMLQPSLVDYGLSLQRKRRTFTPPGSDQEEVVYDYFSFTTDRMLLSSEVEQAAREAFAPYDPQPVLTYLANALGKVIPDDADGTDKNSIPYSTITALDNHPLLGPLVSAAGEPLEPLGEGEIALTAWAAKDQQAEPGDSVRITFFEPETTHGQYAERSADLHLRAVIPLTEPAKPYGRRQPAVFDRRPTLANDPDLTPEVPGVSDQDSIDDWDLPFAMTRPLRSHDDLYWNNHRTTPKAYVALATGQQLWGSRFGRLTSFRIPVRPELDVGILEQRFLEQLRRNNATLGFAFQPLKRKSLEASTGATPFDVLFLALSFFIIAAALILVALLFRLGIEQRAREVGILLAVGLRRRRVRRALVLEGALVATCGGLLGVLVGAGYAWLMLAALRTRWVGAIVTPFLQFHVSIGSLAGGYLAGVLVSVLTIIWTVRSLRRMSNRQLLSGQTESSLAAARRPARSAGWLALGLLVAALGLAVAATNLGGEAQAGAFVGAGAALLTSLLLLAWQRLRRGAQGNAVKGPFVLPRLAARSAQRNPGRSVMTIGLIATASFLIVAMSSFRLDPQPAGMGGFDLMAHSAQPVFVDLNSIAGRAEALGPESGKLAGGTVLGLRLRPGDDASCNNLYQASQPQILGVPAALIEHFDDPQSRSFDWAGSAAQDDAARANPWRLLAAPDGDRELQDAVPVVIDKNTAMYSLKLYGGIGEEVDIRYEGDVTIRFRVVGLLSNSILQGSLLVGESSFLKHFPEIGGDRYFLIQSPAGRGAEVAALLEDRLSDQGLDVRSTRDVLRNLLAVQNTYLETFQSLGALGLLLGTFGLATVQVRSVLERRSELALMRATGFRRNRLAAMVLLENTVLLLSGLAIGVIAALLAVLPHMLTGAATVPRSLQLDLAVLLGIVLIVGLLAGLAAVRTTLRTPLMQALREE